MSSADKVFHPEFCDECQATLFVRGTLALPAPFPREIAADICAGCGAVYSDTDAFFGRVVTGGEIEECEIEERDGFRDDVEADADVLRSAGMGTDEDYGYYGDEEPFGDW